MLENMHTTTLVKSLSNFSRCLPRTMEFGQDLHYRGEATDSSEPCPVKYRKISTSLPAKMPLQKQPFVGNASAPGDHQDMAGAIPPLLDLIRALFRPFVEPKHLPQKYIKSSWHTVSVSRSPELTNAGARRCVAGGGMP